jgi:hypothetical protein
VSSAWNDVTEPHAVSLRDLRLARGILQRLYEHERLLLATDHTLEELVMVVARASLWSKDPTSQAAAIIEALVEHEAVDELYARDEDMMDLVASLSRG